MKKAGRPVTLTFRIPPRAPPRSLKLSRAEMQAKAQKASAVAQRTFGAASVMLRDVQRQYTVEQQRRRSTADGGVDPSADGQAPAGEVQYEIRLPNDGRGIGMVVASSEDGAPYVAEFSGRGSEDGLSRAEQAGVRLGSRILAINGSAVSEGGRQGVAAAVAAAPEGEPLLFLLVAPASATAAKLAEGVAELQSRAGSLRESLKKTREEYVAPLVADLREQASQRLRDLRHKGLPRYEVVALAVVRYARV